MIKQVYIKEQINSTGRTLTGYTSLTSLLRSERMDHLYRSAWLLIKSGNTFNFNNLLIYKINLHHGRNKRSTRAD